MRTCKEVLRTTIASVSDQSNGVDQTSKSKVPQGNDTHLRNSRTPSKEEEVKQDFCSVSVAGYSFRSSLYVDDENTFIAL